MESTLPIKLTTLSLLARMMATPSIWEWEKGTVAKAYTMGRATISICLSPTAEQMVEPLAEMLGTICQVRISDTLLFADIIGSCDKLAQQLDTHNNA